MDTFLIKAAQLILAFAILVIIHEFGHFLFARIFGIRVEKFYMFFNPWFSLCKWKPRHLRELEAQEAAEASHPELKGKKKGKSKFWSETEYGIGWLPLGGYCKIAGMIDESMDTEQMQREPQPWEFRTKPAWQRLLVMIAGVLFNFLLAILIYAGIVYASGEKYVPFQEAKMGMAYSEVAHRAGFKDGDIPLKADGKELSHPGEARSHIMQARSVAVLRDGTDTVEINIPENFIFQLDNELKNKKSKIAFMTYRFPARVSQVSPGDGASKAGIKPGDEIAMIDSIATPDLISFLTALEGHGGETIPVTITRPNNKQGKDTLVVDVPLSEGSKMGIGLETDPSAFYKHEEKKYGLLESVPRGVELGVDRLTSYVSSMKLIFTKEGAKSVGGFGAIGSIFPEKWDWVAFWNIAAFLSVALAFMNILPIPALDGGHVLFLLYEIIFRRPPSQKFMEIAQYTGMIFLILLLLYANGMDIVRFFFK